MGGLCVCKRNIFIKELPAWDRETAGQTEPLSRQPLIMSLRRRPVIKALSHFYETKKRKLSYKYYYIPGCSKKSNLFKHEKQNEKLKIK